MVSGISRPTSRKTTAESRGASRDEHIHHSYRWTRYNQQRNIGTSTPEELSPLFTHRAYATRRARTVERLRDAACADCGKERLLAASYGGRYPRSALQIKVA